MNRTRREYFLLVLRYSDKSFSPLSLFLCVCVIESRIVQVEWRRLGLRRSTLRNTVGSAWKSLPRTKNIDSLAGSYPQRHTYRTGQALGYLDVQRRAYKFTEVSLHGADSMQQTDQPAAFLLYPASFSASSTLNTTKRTADSQWITDPRPCGCEGMIRRHSARIAGINRAHR